MKIANLSPWVIPGLIKDPEIFKPTNWNQDETNIFLINSTGFTIRELKQKSRKADIVSVRRTVLFFLRFKAKMLLSKIADLFELDHSTVIYNVQKFRTLQANKQLNDIEITTLDKLEMALKTFNKNHCPQN